LASIAGFSYEIQSKKIAFIYCISTVKSICKWKTHATRPKGRPRLRWDDDVRDDLRKMGVNNLKQKAHERKPRRGIIEQAKTHEEF